MRNISLAILAITLLGLSIASQAVVIETVRVSDLNNSGTLSGTGVGGYGPNRICGSVAYIYDIGKYEVTAGQYTEFLNKVAKTDTYCLYNQYMSKSENSYIGRSGNEGSYSYSVRPGFESRPINFVSYWDACRFANWLHNGQPSGEQNASTTEQGAYTLDGYNGRDGRTIQRNASWKWAVTSEDEWFKAAYYKGGGTYAGYWDYPMQSSISTLPSNDITNPDAGNSANFYQDGYSVGNGALTDAGEFENSESAYNTFDQAGNVWEWNEATINGAYRGKRGGSFVSDVDFLQASYRDFEGPTYELERLGFRVVQAVPEPSSIIALLGGLSGLIGLRMRKA